MKLFRNARIYAAELPMSVQGHVALQQTVVAGFQAIDEAAGGGSATCTAAFEGGLAVQLGATVADIDGLTLSVGEIAGTVLAGASTPIAEPYALSASPRAFEAAVDGAGTVDISVGAVTADGSREIVARWQAGDQWVVADGEDVVLVPGEPRTARVGISLSTAGAHVVIGSTVVDVSTLNNVPTTEALLVGLFDGEAGTTGESIQFYLAGSDFTHSFPGGTLDWCNGPIPES